MFASLIITHVDIEEENTYHTLVKDRLGADPISLIGKRRLTLLKFLRQRQRQRVTQAENALEPI